MLDLIFSSAVAETMTIGNTVAVLGASLVLGFIISLVYMGTHKKEGYTSAFPFTLIMLPTIIAIIILLVGNNVARAFSLAGAFSLIRFRSEAGNPKDIAYVFFTLAVGLACGMGYIAYAALFVVVLCAVMILLTSFNFAQPKANAMLLKITVPENLNYQGLFDDILSQYTTTYSLIKVKTIEFGSLFEVAYQTKLKDNVDQKKFIDELRCRNGNLKIMLTLKEFEE
jgi:hypothetical protein